MYHTAILRLLILCSCLCLSSCLTIEESYEFKRNGSGSMQYKISLTEMVELLEKVNKDNSALPTDDLSMAEMIPKLESIEGVSQVELLDNPVLKEYGVSFKFKSIEVLNQALNQLIIKDGVNRPHVFFRQKDNILSRTHLMTRNTIAGEFIEKAEESEETLAVLQSINYKLNFKFSRPVKVVYAIADASLIGKSGREVNIETSLKALLEDKETLNTSIVFK